MIWFGKRRIAGLPLQLPGIIVEREGVAFAFVGIFAGSFKMVKMYLINY